MVDGAGNCVVVCSIENLDPMGVHTGDSWTVAPQQTLPDAEYQRLRDAAFTCARTVGVATGGANVQFAYEPASRELVVIEMNPRVSRSSALASKATGFPIAKLAALLAVGYTLDELPNDITGRSSAAFEPALDYVAVKAPRFDFAKFPWIEPALGTEMRAVGESLGLGRTFPEAFLKALEGREDSDELPEIAGLHPYFEAELESIREAERRLAGDGDIPSAKRFGLPDARIARVLGIAEAEVRSRRPLPGRLAVDSCAAEFEARTPYYYLSYEASDGDGRASGSKHRDPRLGAEPDRARDRVRLLLRHAAQAFRALGYEAVLLNSNPETVSTDYDTSDRLYLEPVTLERALDVCALEQPLGVVVTLGGQTPLELAHGLAEAGVPLLGDPLPAIDAAEDRGAFALVLDSLGIRAPRWGVAETRDEALAVAGRIGYPVLVRPHYVLGGRRMRVARGPDELEIHEPSLVDEFLEGAVELDVDVLCDGESGWVAGILEHVEPAGVHSGDSACVTPGPSVTPGARRGDPLDRCERRRGAARPRAAEPPARPARRRAARDRGEPARIPDDPVRGEGDGAALVDLACRLMLGERLADLDLPGSPGRRGPGPRRRSSPRIASRAPPTVQRRCARPAR